MARENFSALLSTRRVPPPHRHLLEGPPADALISFVQRQKIDLLVMGSFSRGWIHNVMVGSTTDRIRILDPLP